MGRSLSIIKRCSAFLTTLSTRQVLQALDSSHLDYCSVVCSGATKTDFGKLQLAQNRAARLSLKSKLRANINDMHLNLSWLKVEEIDIIITCFCKRCRQAEGTKLSVLKSHQTAWTLMHTPQDMHQRSLHSLQVQDKPWQAHSTTVHRAMTT
jgi:hypothetical protein